MSQPLSRSEILYVQRKCSCCGFYGGPLDGRWSQSVADGEERLSQEAAALKAEIGSFDARTETNISTLMPVAQKIARLFMKSAAGFGFTVRIISGSRTYAEQDELYAIGRTVQRNRATVTDARGGQSNHNFGIAWDVGIFAADGSYMRGITAAEVRAYKELGARAKAAVAGIEWGGDWTSRVDRPHYQLPTGKPIAEVRRLFEAGRRFWS